jgi:hypothetical protein
MQYLHKIRKDWIKSCLPQSVARPQNYTNYNLTKTESTKHTYITNVTVTHICCQFKLTTFAFLEKGLLFNINHILILNVIHLLKK